MTADSEAGSRGQRMGAARRERRLEAAKRAYREQFGEDAPAPPDTDHPRCADALMEAVESGRPLTAEALAKWLGDPRYGRWSGPWR
jgi:hypothetical protein